MLHTIQSLKTELNNLFHSNMLLYYISSIHVGIMGGGLKGNDSFPVPAHVNVAPPQIPGKHRERKNG